MRGGALSTSALALAAALVFGDAARAEEEEEGELTQETRQKLERRVTFEEEAMNLAGFARVVGEQTGLSFAMSTLVAHLPEPVTVLARDVPAGELIEAVAFSMHLDYTITPNGIVSFRTEPDDPRCEALLRHRFREMEEHRRREREEREERRGEGPPPRLDEDEVLERVEDHPKVRALLEKLDGELDPVEFHREKRVWELLVRREDEEEPLARVFANEDGKVVHIERLRGEDRRERRRKKEEHDRERDKEHGRREERERF